MNLSARSNPRRYSVTSSALAACRLGVNSGWQVLALGLGLATDRPREPFSGPTRPIPGRARMKRRRQGRSIRLCIDTSFCAARLCSRPFRR